MVSAMTYGSTTITLNEPERRALEGLVANRNTPAKVVWRAKIILATARGLGTMAIMPRAASRRRPFGAGRSATPRKASRGFCATRRDRPARRRSPTRSRRRCSRRPRPRRRRMRRTGACARWRRRSALAHTSVQRIWQEAGLKPHLVRTFKISNDPQFEEKVIDVVGLYMNPPDKALVLCVDEKSQIQALDRTQPGLPLKPGRAATMTHDYKRHGTTTLFAALDVRTGLVIGECLPRHRAKEFLRFLRKIDRATKKSLDLHLVLDNYATHKTPAGEGVARQASPLPPPLHADEGFVAEPRRALLRRDHDEAHPPRRIQERRRAGGRDPRLSRPAQRRPKAVRLDQDRQCSPRQGAPSHWKSCKASRAGANRLSQNTRDYAAFATGIM